MIFHRELEANLRVCPHCGHHMRIGRRRAGSSCCSTTASTSASSCPRASRSAEVPRHASAMPTACSEAQAKTGEQDAIIVAHGTIDGLPVVIAAFNFDFMGGSMGSAVGDGLIAAARLAVLQEAPLIVIPGLGRRAHAGRHPLPDADAAHHHRRRRGEGSGPALYRGADRSHHRRRQRLLRHAGRHPDRRAGRGDRLRRRARDRGDDPREAARGLPARRISAASTAWSTWSCRAASCATR